MLSTFVFLKIMILFILFGLCLRTRLGMRMRIIPNFGGNKGMEVEERVHEQKREHELPVCLLGGGRR